MQKIKINAVLLKEQNDQDLPAFIDWVEKEDLSVRFIELMQTGEADPAFLKKRQISSAGLVRDLNERGWQEQERGPLDGPARVFRHGRYQGSIGIIAPYSRGFCSTCNRLRVSSFGRLQLCLFGVGGFDLRPFLQSKAQKGDLMTAIQQQLKFKEEAHFLHEGNTGTTPHLASIGG